MKKSILSLIVAVCISAFSIAQETENVGPESYKLLKFDALNLMGIGVQKLHLGLELSPMIANVNNLPTIQFNLTAPFNSLNNLDMNYGIEGGAELRFYQRRRNKKELAAEGFYMGVGLDGGYVNFSREEQYYSKWGSGINQTATSDYGRTRTGIYFLSGAQSKLGQKLYFDVNIGLGWSNVNVKETDTDLQGNPEDFNKYAPDFNPFYILYEEGKYQRFYMPVSFGIGYNFGSK